MSSRVQVSLRVAASPLRVFDVFTREIGAWWRSNGLFQFTPQGAGVLSFELPSEPGEHGRLVETQPDGSVFEVGRVTVWEPGQRLASGQLYRRAAHACRGAFRSDRRRNARNSRASRLGYGAARPRGVPPLPDRVFLLRHGEWWQALLASLREAVSQTSTTPAPPG